jgi:hypothetical protein
MRPMLSSTAVEEDAAIPCAIEMVDDEEEAVCVGYSLWADYQTLDGRNAARFMFSLST